MNDRRLRDMHRLRERRQLARAATSAGPVRVDLRALYGMYSTPDLPLGSFEQFARHAYGAMGEVGNSAVFACMGRRMSVFSEASFKWRALDGKRLFGTPDLLTLEKPWPGGSSGSLLARAQQDVGLGGNFYARSTGDGVERLRPDWVTIVSMLERDVHGAQVRRVIGYWYEPAGDCDREAAFYPVDEVAHWAPVPDPLAHFRGMSWLTPVIREINADMRMSQFRDAYFDNAATANIIVTYKDKVSPSRIEKIQQALRAEHAGPDNAFGSLVFDEGADVTVVGADMNGASFDKISAAGETRICAAAGVPAIVAGMREGLLASQIGEYAMALRSFADLTMRPEWRSLCAALETVCPPPPGAQLWTDLSDVSALRQGEKDLADTQAAQAVTINTLIMAGFQADSVVQAVISGDLTVLVHSGLTSVQMQPPSGTAPSKPTNGKVPALAGVGG